MAMKLREIRLWQWLLLAIAFGGALAWVHTGADRFGDGAWRPGLDNAQFESLLRLSKLPTGTEVFRDLTIYPSRDRKTYIAGEHLDLANPDRYRKFEYFADESLNIREVLRTKYPSVHFTYAWWEDVRVQRAFWFGLPLCLIGLICPALVRAFASKLPPATEDIQQAPPPVPIVQPWVEPPIGPPAVVNPPLE